MRARALSPLALPYSLSRNTCAGSSGKEHVALGQGRERDVREISSHSVYTHVYVYSARKGLEALLSKSVLGFAHFVAWPGPDNRKFNGPHPDFCLEPMLQVLYRPLKKHIWSFATFWLFSRNIASHPKAISFSSFFFHDSVFIWDVYMALFLPPVY